MSKNEFFDFYSAIECSLNLKNSKMSVLLNYLKKDKEFLELVDQTISPSSKKSVDKTKEELDEDFSYYIHNGMRSIILNVLIMQYVSNKVIENFSLITQDEYWCEVVDKLKNLLG